MCGGTGPCYLCAGPGSYSRGIRFVCVLPTGREGSGRPGQDWNGLPMQGHPPRKDGNSPGCVTDNDVKVSQHFVASSSPRMSVIKVLRALQKAAVVTDPGISRIVKNGDLPISRALYPPPAARPPIPPSTAGTGNLGTPGPVEIATTGQRGGTTIGLKAGPEVDANHAKIGCPRTRHNLMSYSGT